MNIERTCMRLEDLHAKLLRHKRKEVETMVKLGILASSVKNSEYESNPTLLFQSELRSSSTLHQSHGTRDLEKPAQRRRYVAVLDTSNAFHVINIIAPKGCENVDPELRSFSRVDMDHHIHKNKPVRDGRKGKKDRYSSGAAMTHSAFI
ncbi:hypothetical protein GL50803_0029081 [Giardia duodenalis]|uniref:Uncharacterized protein n=1 Tax=Giardia intestinalis (strain ATCC 50803 / WB clone C6) TaxID=184922 RepID=D3KH03_GIAIC|nr:hypothetical protein GL50803_0029081 [Giardia intestinalis]KAE8304202.1 hypothetical protein GL50803_0029081 [Giardia intestinalis]